MTSEELERETPDQTEAAQEVLADDLVEDVSIDGMCGVY
ncbi:mycofactocin precursor [Flexivirga caeni]|uniref:Mycofactocin n=2 Tax=Flexivirga caeni TaxID=2294115 RepID=A0A3M9M428_9MICO|nr:mycofactocin precursor [Flexivirga caeni]